MPTGKARIKGSSETEGPCVQGRDVHLDALSVLVEVLGSVPSAKDGRLTCAGRRITRKLTTGV